MKLLRFVAVSVLLAFAMPSFATERPPPPDIQTLEVRADQLDDVVVLAAGEPIPAPSPASSSIGDVLKQFVSPTSITSLVLLILGLVGGASWFSAQRKEQVAIVTQHAFNGVLDFSKTTETDVDDKIAVGLRLADEWMVKQGWRKLKPDERDVVKLGFGALHGAEVQAVKVQAEAIKQASANPQ